MGVKYLWRKLLGLFRDEDLRKLESLPDNRIVVDTSAWVHKLDGNWGVKYARTSDPPYCHPDLINYFARRIDAMKRLGLHLIFVFDGISPNLKKRTNRKRQDKSAAARKEYDDRLADIKASGRTATDEERQKLLSLRRDIARPTPEDYAGLRQWMENGGIECVQAPFEADAQMKRLIIEGRASAAVTEDGDLVVLEVEHIWSQCEINALEPRNSECQYFDMEELKAGTYEAPLNIGKRIDYLPELSCFLGNDYIDNYPGVGQAAILGTQKRNPKKAIIDSYIERTETEREWLSRFDQEHRDRVPTGTELTPERWSVDRFICVRNLIRHYPVFKRNPISGQVCIVPLNPLPDDVDWQKWGEYIGFEKHPLEYFLKDGNDYTLNDYYGMDVVASTGKRRADHLWPTYTAEENPTVAPTEPLPLFARVSFDKDPVEVQPSCVLRRYLLSRGVPLPENCTHAQMQQWVRTSKEINRVVLNPELVPKPVKWVAFEPLGELAVGDEFDEWNRDYISKLRQMKSVDNEYIDRHFGTEHAQYERATAFILLKGGNIGLCTIKVRNVQSKLRPGKRLIAFKFDCLSKERPMVHHVYIVFEDESGEFVPSPASYCSCENGAFFCSHMLCFLYVMRLIQAPWAALSQDEIEEMYPMDRRVVQTTPCLIEYVLAMEHLNKQKGQTKRQAAAQK